MGERATESEAATVQQSTPGPDAGSLTVWTLATANTTLFVLALLVPSYASGGLSDALASLNTTVGVVVFGYLWLVVWVSTRWLLARVDPAGATRSRLVLWAATVGALDGIVFLLGIVLGLGVPSAVLGPVELVTIALVAAIGVPIAAVVGAVVALAALLLDLIVLSTADALRPRPRSDRR